MPKFNEPELYLLQEWSNARLFEESMESVREKYEEMFEKVVDQVQEKHPEMDARDIRLSNDGVNVGIGRSVWRTKASYYISGFWLGEIRIDNLTSEEEKSPDKTVWVNHPDGNINMDLAKKRLLDAAQGTLTKEEFRRIDTDWGTGISGITYPILQSRAELFKLLLKDERDFASCMIAHFESMMRFAPILDDIFRVSKRSRL